MANAKLLTLSEVSRRANISMPTLQRYKKEYQDRIPSQGEGRKQRYPASAIAVFQQIKKENVSKRGRPSRQASSSGAKAKAKGGRRASSRRQSKKASPAKKGDLLTLKEVSKRVGVSYPTASRYAKIHQDEIPSEGEGRKRRYPVKAVDVFKRLKKENAGRRGGRRKASTGRSAAPAVRTVRGRGRKAGKSESDLVKRIQALEKSQSSLEQQVRALIKQNRKPLRVTIQRV
ncbi:MAG: helix-turn-helix domain-containing protein [Acidobacteriota bacterium]